MTIDGTTQLGYVDRPLVEVRGPVAIDDFQQERPTAQGLVFAATSTGSIVSGLALTRFTDAVVLVGDGISVVDSWIGVGADGAVRPNVTGVLVNGDNNTIGRGNVLSNNEAAGVSITGSGTVVIGNLIGLQPGGAFAAGNFAAGVSIEAGAANTRIGGTVAADRNVISGNTLNGISAQSAGGTSVLGNYIGTDIAGAFGVGNTTGIALQSSPATISGNVVSGNIGLDTGIAIVNSPGTVIEGNFIGTDATGTVALGNDGAGISIDSGSNYVVAGNVSSGNGRFDEGQGGPVFSPHPGIEAFFLSDLTIQGNRIGTNAAGASALPNSIGIVLFDTSDVVIGGTVAGQGNLISGNDSAGIVLFCGEFGGPSNPDTRQLRRHQRGGDSGRTQCWRHRSGLRDRPRSSGGQRPALATSSRATAVTASSTWVPTGSSRATGSASTPTATPWATRARASTSAPPSRRWGARCRGRATSSPSTVATASRSPQGSATRSASTASTTTGAWRSTSTMTARRRTTRATRTAAPTPPRTSRSSLRRSAPAGWAPSRERSTRRRDRT